LIDRGGFDRIDANLQKEVYLTFNGCLCLEFEKMAGDSHYFFVLAKTGLIFCKIPKVFCGAG